MGNDFRKLSALGPEILVRMKPTCGDYGTPSRGTRGGLRKGRSLYSHPNKETGGSACTFDVFRWVVSNPEIKFVAAGPVSRILSAGLLRQDGHSSGPNITVRLKRPTRRLWRAEPARAPGEAYSARPRLPPYLVLLRVGFALPAALLRRRCALTAPFHPYPGVAARAVYFLWHFPSNGPPCKPTHPPGRYPAHCSVEFGLSSPAA